MRRLPPWACSLLLALAVVGLFAMHGPEAGAHHLVPEHSVMHQEVDPGTASGGAQGVDGLAVTCAALLAGALGWGLQVLLRRSAHLAGPALLAPAASSAAASPAAFRPRGPGRLELCVQLC